MSGISTSIQMADQMTPVLRSITSAMNMMVSSFSAAQSMTETGFNTVQVTAMQQAVASASAEFAQYQEQLERVQNTPLPSPPTPPEPPRAPTWEGLSSSPVYMTSGADRFESEYKAASTAAQQLYNNQQAISAQARSLRVVPPGMLNDVAATSNRIQGLSVRVQELNNIPVDLRTDQVNNEMEALRNKLAEAAAVQEQLNAAMGQMDISAANAAYQHLNSIVDSTERDIRDNFTAQEQFNRSVQGGQTAASGLESSIKQYAALLISAASAGKAISLADQVTQTTARLDLMNYGLDTTDQLQQKIFESAQRSRGVYQTTADAVSKLGMQARGAFSSNDELIAFAEQLNKTFVIAGASAQGVDSVMLQLTQSMASGKLQGEELNAVLDNAQPIVQNIADYMDVPVGKIKELAADGAISAEIIKNAMFAAADETNAKFGQMPVTFSQVANSIGNQALMAFQPALQQLSAVTQTEGFAALTNSITGAIQTLASASVSALDMMGQAIQWAQENWSWLGPVIGSVTAAVVIYTGAMTAYNTVQAISNGLKTISAIVSVAHGAAITGEMVATTGLTAAQIGFNAALLACPLTWIVVAIIAVVAAIAIWINHMGGIKVAWLTVVNAVLTMAESMGLGFWHAVMNIQNSIEYAKLGFMGFKTAVLNTLGNLKVQGLMILQNFINGAIDHINTLINLANSIGVISIDTIQHVEFGTNAALEEEMKQGQRASELSSASNQVRADVQARQDEYARRQAKVEESRAKRQADIENARTESNKKKQGRDIPGTEGGWDMGAVAEYTGDTAANTAAMKDSMDILDEDLKYMRDAAEQEIINRFTLAELKVDVNNSNTLTTQTDFDDVNRQLAAVTSEILATAAEGDYL